MNASSLQPTLGQIRRKVEAGERFNSADGEFLSSRHIGDTVVEGDEVASVAGKPVVAAVGGIVRGLIADGLNVREGEKVGDVDPRGSETDPGAISDKARAVGGAVLEALLMRGVLPRDAG